LGRGARDAARWRHGVCDLWTALPNESIDRLINPPAARQGHPRSCRGHGLDARDGARPGTFTDVDGEVSRLAGLRTASEGPRSTNRAARYSIRMGLRLWRWALGSLGRWVSWALGSLGRWALGVRQGHPRGVDRRRGHFTAASIERSEAPFVCTAMVCSPLRQVQRRASCGRALGVGRAAGSPPGDAPEGRWVALPPPVSRRPGSYTSPRPRRRRP
jgi:hypothetical protein